MRRNYNFDRLKEKESEILDKLLIYANSYKKNLDKDQVSYHQSYSSFINFFESKSKSELNLDDIVIGMSFTYSWMPTMLTIDILDGQGSRLVSVLNKVHLSKEYLNENDLRDLKKAMNNSLVGSSKLLHFISPEIYPILDSRVMEFLFGGSSYERITQPQFYLDYVEYMRNLAKHPVVTNITKKLNLELESNLSSLRALEFSMYEEAVNRAKLGKEKKTG